MYAPAEGTRPPGRSCRTAEGQAGLAVTQEAAQAQAAGSRTLHGREETEVTSHQGLKDIGRAVDSGVLGWKGTESRLRMRKIKTGAGNLGTDKCKRIRAGSKFRGQQSGMLILGVKTSLRVKGTGQRGHPSPLGFSRGRH